MGNTFNILDYGIFVIVVIAFVVAAFLLIVVWGMSKYEDVVKVGIDIGKEATLNSVYVWISSQLKREDLKLESPETMLDLFHDWAEEERVNLYGQECYTANFIYIPPENREKQSIDIRDLWNKELEEE